MKLFTAAYSLNGLRIVKIKLNVNSNIRPIVTAVILSSSNCFPLLIRKARRCATVAATVMAIALTSPVLANTITFETAPFGAGFSGPVTEAGFAYSKLNGALFVNNTGNPGQDVEGQAAVVGAAGGGVLKIVSATSGDFDFNALDFAAFDILGTGSQTLKVEGFLSGLSVGVDQYTLSNTKIFNPKYGNWTTEAASILAGKSISELGITLNASAAGSGSQFLEAADDVVLTPEQAAISEPSSLALLAAAAGASFVWLRRRRSSAA